MALLTLSLNAQQKGEEKTSQPKAPTEKSVGHRGSGSLRASTTPVTPPYVNEFNSQNDFNWWEVISDGYGNTWAYDSDGECASYSYSTYYAANDWLVTAPVYLEAGKNYTFSIDASAGNSSYPEQMEVKMATGHTANSLSSGTTVIASTTLTSTDYATFSNVVTVSQTGNYYFGIHATSPRDRAYLYVDNFSIKFTHDLAVYLSAPHTSNAGSTFTVVATVYNPGASAETGYTVNFTAGGTTISTQTANTSLAPGAVTTFTVEYSTNASDAGQTVNFGATVASTGDSNADNNTSTASTSLTSILPPPVNVQATGGEQSGTMTWNAPTITPESVTEDFEYTKDFPSFGLGGITSSVHTGAFGDWTLYDANGGNVYGSTEENFPNEAAPHAWFVFNPTMIGSGSTAHSGDQYVESVCPQGSSNNPANHWLISPELSGNAQTITFWDREFTTNYGDETFTVWVSTTDNNPSSFTHRVGNYTIDYTDWHQRSISLPAGAKYFAIQHTSNDIFGMTIDDLTYEAAPVNPVSYNVYLDGDLVGNVNSNDPLTYTFNDVIGEHQCAVSAVYPNGIESARVPATFIATSPDPELTAPENGSTVNVGTNYGLGVSTTIPVSGNHLNQDLIVSVDNSDFSVSPTSISAADAMAGTTITVTYTGTDPNATATLTIGSNEVSTTVNLTASYVYMTPVLTTSPTNGSYLNMVVNQGSSTTQTITVSGEYLTEGLTVSVTGDGFSVSPTTISAADANNGSVTVTVTYDGSKPISSGTLTIGSSEVSDATIHLIASTPGGSTNLDTHGIIRMGNLIIVDQFNESTAKNDHPKTYKYVLKYEPEDKSSSPVEVDVEQTNSIVYGYYTADDVKNDSAVYNTVIVNKLAADVEMNLPDNDNEIYYVRLQSKKDDVPQAADKVKDNFDMLAKLQLISGDGGFYYSDALPESHPQSDPGEYHYTDKSAETGVYAVDYKTYVPSIMTYGFDRHYFADDTLHNTYGAPIWKTGVGQVNVHSAIVERQIGKYGSANWEAPGTVAGSPDQVDPNNTVPASLVLLHNVQADGFLPSMRVSNVEYVPYKFHVYVYSASGKLRGYIERAAGEDGMSGTHVINDDNFTNYTGPICIYSKDVSEETVETLPDENNDGKGVTLVIPLKQQGSTEWEGYPSFGALDSAIPGDGQQINENDLQIFIRFYYKSAGNESPSEMRGAGDVPEAQMYYGSEGKFNPSGWTALNEIVNSGHVVGVTYVNPQGMQSDRPFEGLNIVITRYSDGSTTTTKVIK